MVKFLVYGRFDKNDEETIVINLNNVKHFEILDSEEYVFTFIDNTSKVIYVDNKDIVDSFFFNHSINQKVIDSEKDLLSSLTEIDKSLSAIYGGMK